LPESTEKLAAVVTTSDVATSMFAATAEPQNQKTTENEDVVVAVTPETTKELAQLETQAENADLERMKNLEGLRERCKDQECQARILEQERKLEEESEKRESVVREIVVEKHAAVEVLPAIKCDIPITDALVGKDGLSQLALSAGRTGVVFSKMEGLTSSIRRNIDMFVQVFFVFFFNLFHFVTLFQASDIFSTINRLFDKIYKYFLFLLFFLLLVVLNFLKFDGASHSHSDYWNYFWKNRKVCFETHSKFTGQDRRAVGKDEGKTGKWKNETGQSRW
jgi:hypothetical protein